MSNKNAHIIQKQVIDITLPDANTAFEWEANNRRDFVILLNQELERSFDEFDKEGNYLVIDKLHLDLGDFSWNDLNTAMPVRLRSELEKTLQQHVDQAIQTHGYSGVKEKLENEESKKEDRYYKKQTGQLEALCFFLKKGNLPWWGSELRGWDEDWMQQLSEEEINSLKNFLTGNEDLIRRLSTQFNDEFMNHLLKRMGIAEETDQTWYWLKRILKILQQKNREELSQKDYSDLFPVFNLPVIRAKYWCTWVNYVLGKSKKPALHGLLSHQPDALTGFHKLLQNESLEKFDPLLSETVPGIWKEELFALQNKTTVNNQKELTQDASLKETNRGTDNKLSLKDLAINKINIEDELDTLFINDAGLILLHPFLLQLFTKCGWVENKKFVNIYTQTMAVYGLHYLATGETLPLEHRLTFPKLLAGIEWETPLEPVEPLNDIEKAACDELLSEVLKHWNALGNSSPGGLREAFLQRTAKLEYLPSGWHLTIEHKTLDILLNRLPWGISLVKLPWMKDLLTVTWQ